METKEISKLYKVTVWLFLIGNFFACIMYGGGFYLTVENGEPIPAFEYLRVPLYFIDVIAFYLLLKLKPVGFVVIITTSVLYALAHWYNGIFDANIFQGFGTTPFYMFVLAATVLPFIDVVLLYILGNKHITKRSNRTQ